MTFANTFNSTPDLSFESLLLLAAHCNKWLGQRDSSVIKDIISHPYSRLCTSIPDVDVIFKSIPVSAERFNQNNNIKIRPFNGILTFNTIPDKIDPTLTLDKAISPMAVFKKKFDPADLELNFTQLLKELRRAGFRINLFDLDQTQLWMRCTQTTFHGTELIGFYER